MSHVENLLAFLDACPTSFHAGCETARILEEAGYTLLEEGSRWDLQPLGKYYVRRGLSAVIAFRIPAHPKGFMMVASHGDSPTFHITPHPEKSGKYTKLSVEKYGGMLCATWMDKPLGVAGSVTLKQEGGIRVVPVKVDRDLVIIPSVAIHMNRSANDGATYNPAVDMQPLFGEENLEEGTLGGIVADTLGVDKANILHMDLSLYNRQKGCVMGAEDAFLGAPRLDDLACAYASLAAFLESGDGDSIPVHVLFDHEEVGSSTAVGAGGDFLCATLERITRGLGLDYEASRILYANSMMVSSDNAHAVHPNHPEYANPLHAPVMNGGVVIKYNANKRYTTDGVTGTVFSQICESAGVKTQTYCNRADIPGGSTLGAISLSQVTVPSVDIGLAQLAMHSSFETMGARDIAYMVQALKTFFATSLTWHGDAVTIDGASHEN